MNTCFFKKKSLIGSIVKFCAITQHKCWGNEQLILLNSMNVFFQISELFGNIITLGAFKSVELFVNVFNMSFKTLQIFGTAFTIRTFEWTNLLVNNVCMIFQFTGLVRSMITLHTFQWFRKFMTAIHVCCQVN